MSGRVEGKVVIVTGGGTGIGRASAELLAREGARVVVANRSEETGRETVRRVETEGGQATFVQTDVSREADCQRCVEEAVAKYGRLDGLVNNAGIFPRASLADTTEEFWDQIMATNLKGPYFMCRHAIPKMQAGPADGAHGGSIVNVGSIHGLVGAPQLFAYATSKGGLLTMTRNLARAFAKDLIRVNYLIPGWVITEGEMRIRGEDADTLAQRGSTQPMGRLQRPEDAAKTVLFLISDESDQITGAVLNTDGGSSVFSSPRGL